MRRGGLVLSIACVCAAACGVKDKSQITVPLGAAKLVVQQKDGAHHELAMDAKGAVTWDGAVIGRLDRSGRFFLGSHEALHLIKDGKTMVGARPANVVVRADGTLEVDEQVELSIAADGAVTGPLIDTLDHPRFDPTGGSMRYEGPAAERQPLMLAMAAFVTSAPSIPLP